MADYADFAEYIHTKLHTRLLGCVNVQKVFKIMDPAQNPKISNRKGFHLVKPYGLKLWNFVRLN